MKTIFRKPRTVKRTTQGGYVDGYWVDGEETEQFTARMSVQPLRGFEFEALPEGRRGRQSVRLYSSKRLKPILDNDGTADRVVINGEEFEVYSTEPWQNGVQSHYKSIAQLIVDEGT